MTAVLTCGPVEVPVPEGWTAAVLPNNAFELATAAQEVAVSLTVQPRRPELDRDPGELLALFASSAGVAEGSELPTGADRADDHDRTVTRFSTPGHRWIAMVLRTREHVTIATVTAPDGKDEALGAGERILEAVSPVRRR